MYIPAIKSALQTARREKRLWLLAVLAAALGNLGEIEIISASLNLTNVQGNALFSFWQGLFASGIFSGAGLSGIREAIGINPLAVGLVGLIYFFVFIFGLLAIWLTVSSQSTLISALANKEQKLRSIWKHGRSKFWAVLLMNIISKGSAILLLFGLVIAATAGSATATLPFIFIYVILLALVLVISFITKYATIGIVTEDLKVKEALTKSRKIFTKNWLITLEVAFVTLVVSTVALLLWTVLSVVIALPFVALVTSLNLSAGMSGALLITGTVITFALLIILTAAITIFYWSLWISSYQQISSNRLTAWLHRRFGSH
ncbi:hypothetical protein CL634_11050 [bacterium]|nr:hypothetical protein [bacterium]|tara:strand:- start:330 stop:1280 length:951 start_codon:yes stop_codon:yes gene_type:complete